MVDGYYTTEGYCGYVENEGYMIFETEKAYLDYLRELFEKDYGGIENERI